MKIYTEEQVKLIYQQGIYSENVLKHYTPIELPSDEEIGVFSAEIYPEIAWGIEGSMIRSLAHCNGAKWVIEQIKQQADEK